MKYINSFIKESSNQSDIEYMLDEIKDTFQEIIDEYSLYPDEEDYIDGEYYSIEHRYRRDDGLHVFFLFIKYKNCAYIGDISKNKPSDSFFKAVESTKDNVLPVLRNIGYDVGILNDPTESNIRSNFWVILKMA